MNDWLDDPDAYEPLGSGCCDICDKELAEDEEATGRCADCSQLLAECADDEGQG